MWFDSYNYVSSKYDFSIYPNDIKKISSLKVKKRKKTIRNMTINFF